MSYAIHDLHGAVTFLFVLGMGEIESLSTAASNAANVPALYDQ